MGRWLLGGARVPWQRAQQLSARALLVAADGAAYLVATMPCSNSGWIQWVWVVGAPGGGASVALLLKRQGRRCVQVLRACQRALWPSGPTRDCSQHAHTEQCSLHDDDCLLLLLLCAHTCRGPGLVAAVGFTGGSSCQWALLHCGLEQLRHDQSPTAVQGMMDVILGLLPDAQQCLM